MEKFPKNRTFEEQNGFLTPSFFDNPYPYYHKLREHDPVYWSQRTQSWLVTSYNEVSIGLRDKSFSVKRGNVNIDILPGDIQKKLHPLRSFYSSWLMYMDPPEHTRLRQLAGKALSPKMVDGMRSGIEETANQLLSSISNRKGSINLMSDFAKPLSISVMANMFNISSYSYSKIEKWSNELVGFLGMRNIDSEKARTSQAALLELMSYLVPIFQERQRNPKNDLISQLIVAKENDETLSEQEILAVCTNILIDGHEPIANAIGNGVLAFLQNPSQVERLNENSLLAESVVDEVLRYDPPFQYSARKATENIELGNKIVQKGQRVQFMLGAANRDPKFFPNPDNFDISRKGNKHTSFGFGSHYCIGATLGRAVLDIAFTQLSQRLPNFKLANQELVWHQSLGYRGLKSLYVLDSKGRRQNVS